MNNYGDVEGLSLQRLVIHELAHQTLGLSDLSEQSHLNGLDTPDFDFRGNTVDFTNTVLSQMGIQTERLHYWLSDEYGAIGTQWTGGNEISNVYLGTEAIENLDGSSDDELFFGADGNDTINGNGGNDYIYAGSGNDNVDVTLGSNVIDGGTGNDTLSYENLTSGVNVDMSAKNTVLMSGGPIKDVFDNIENITGTNYADIILGDSKSNAIKGGTGDDILEGGSGLDLYQYDITGGTVQSFGHDTIIESDRTGFTSVGGYGHG
ncbi:MAG: hypothetical protein P8P30_04330 [Rickettsiales bacterium]|nr:hypothetical protein [Rickettsiales bacterium]